MNGFTKALVMVLALALPAVGQCAEAGSKSAKAPSEKIYKVSEIYKSRGTLDKQKVTVKGKVVKVASGIMNKNWIHLQDGSGSPAKKDNDLTVTTTQDLPAVGKIVTVTGILAKGKDFGSGYYYEVILENSTLK